MLKAGPKFPPVDWDNLPEWMRGSTRPPDLPPPEGVTFGLGGDDDRNRETPFWSLPGFALGFALGAGVGAAATVVTSLVFLAFL